MAGGVGNTSSAVCKRCKKPTLTNVIKCIKCTNCFHLSCAKLYVNIKTLDESTFTCCDIESESKVHKEIDSAFWAALNDSTNSERGVDVRIFNYVVRQKDILIDELRDKIKLLNQQVDTMKNSALTKKGVDKMVDQSQFENKNKQFSASKSIVSLNVSDKTLGHKSIIKNTTVADVISGINKSNSLSTTANAETLTATTRISQSTDEVNRISAVLSNNTTEPWNTVVQRRNKNRGIHKHAVIGEKITGDTNLKVVPKKAFIFVSRLEPGTKSEAIVELIKTEMPEAQCEELKSKFPQIYTSFKVTVDMQNLDKIMNSKLWPSGAYVSRFFHRRQTTMEAS